MMQYRNRGTIMFSKIKLGSIDCCTDDMFLYADLDVCIALVHLTKSLIFQLDFARYLHNVQKDDLHK